MSAFLYILYLDGNVSLSFALAASLRDFNFSVSDPLPLWRDRDITIGHLPKLLGLLLCHDDEKFPAWS